MAGPSYPRNDLPDSLYSIIDLDAMTAEHDAQEMLDPGQSPASSAPSSRPASRGRGDRHQARQQKRREQNKAAQRSFRARKEQHLSELLSRIESLELRKKTIEEENQALMHELLRKRAENNLLRSRRPSRVTDTSWDQALTRRMPPARPAGALLRPPVATTAGLEPSTKAAGKRPVRSGDDSGSGGRSRDDNFALQQTRDVNFVANTELRRTAQRARTLPVEALMWLYGPFLDVWNLIKEQPAVERGDVDIDEVVDRLKEMARYEDAASATGSSADMGEAMSTSSSTVRPFRSPNPFVTPPKLGRHRAKSL